MSGRRRSALLGMLFSYASLLIALARNIAFVPLYLAKIPLSEYGAWLATGGALALLLINDYGLSGVVTQRISTDYGAGSLERIGRLTGSALAIGAILSFLLTCISLACVPLLPGLQTLRPTETHTIVRCFQISIAANALGVLGATAASVLRSLQRVVLMGSVVLASDLANVAIILLGLFAGYGLYAIAVGLLVRSAMLAVMSLHTVWFVCSKSLRSPLAVAGSDVRSLLAESSHFFLSAIAMKLQAQANVLFASAVLGPASAAIYSLTVRAHETVLMLIGQINGALVPSATHLFGSGNMARFREVMLRVLVSIGTLTAFALTITVILDSAFLRLWVGQYAFGGQVLSVLMATALFVSSIGYVAYDALIAQGKFRFVSSLFLATSVLQVSLLESEIHRGLWIGPMTTLVTSCVWSLAFWRRIAIDHELIAAGLHALLKEAALIVAASTVVAAAFILFYPTPKSWLSLVAEGLLSIACVGCGYLALSRTIRTIVSEELALTVRLLRSA
jgi:O-antigen/teichoic acid export membrane protein